MQTPHRHPAALAVMERQHGIITRAQALDVGLSPDDLQRIIRSGEWVAIRRGHYVTRDHLARLDEYVGRPQLEARVAWMGLCNDYAVSQTRPRPSRVSPR